MLVTPWITCAFWCLVLCGKRLTPKMVIKTVTSWASLLFRPDRTQRETDRKVCELVSIAQAQRSWQLVVFAGVWANLAALNMLPLSIRRGVWDEVDETGLKFAGHALRSVIMSMMALFLVLSGPRSQHTMQKIRVILELGGVLIVWTFADSEDVLLMMGYSWVARVLGAVVFGNVRLTSALSVLVFTSDAARVWNSPYATAFMNTIPFQCFVSLAFPISCALSELVWKRDALAMMNSSFSVRSEATSKEMLNLICDAVVTLDESLRLQDPSPALAALLFRTSRQSLIGVAFEEFVREVDRARFQEFMAGTVLSQCLHLDLNDANGSRVAVQLFHSRLEGILGQTTHVLGVREEADGQYVRPLPEMDDIEVIDSFIPSTDKQEEFVSVSSGTTDFQECSVTIDAGSRNFALMTCTPCFTAICGPPCGEGLLDWLRGDKNTFINWVQDSVHGEVCNDGVDIPMHVTLAPPHLRSVGHIHADCRARLEDLEEDEESDDNDVVLVKIILSKLSMKRRRKRPQAKY